MATPGASTPMDAVAEAVLLADVSDATSLRAIGDALATVRDAGVATTAEATAALETCLASAAALTRVRGAAKRAAALETLTHDIDALRAALRARVTADAGAAAAMLAADPALVADFISRAGEHADEAERQVLFLDANPSDRESLDAAFRAFHTVKGMAGFLAFDAIQTICHDAETVLDSPRHGESELSSEAVQSLLGSVDALREAVASVGGDPSPQPPTDAPSEQRVSRDTHTTTEGRTVRVDEARLDRLLDAIGELVVAQTMIVGATSELVDVWGPVAGHFAHLDKLTRELQDMATSLRMVPLAATVRKMARLVRDLAHDAGKQVEFVASGEDTELDRALVDVVADALVHLLRNAMDHGIESPAERAAAGKPEAGTVTLSAYHQGGSVHIDVIDDGRGVDPARVIEKARSLGLLAEGEQPTDREALALVMAPGFSTAEKVTAVSGRGVGMDAVRRTVEDLHGQIDITSAPGKGTRFHLRVPLTLAVIDGMVVRVGDERYIVPTASIIRSVRPTPAQLTSVLGGGTVMQTEGGLVPLVMLADLFGVHDAEKDPTAGVVTVVSDGERQAGIAACELVGQQQVVIKPLGEAFRGMPGLAGGAIMPDGTVGLIADVAGLIELVSTERG